MPQPAEILVICALREELEALKAVEAGRSSEWVEVGGKDPYWMASFTGTHGVLRIAAARPTRMGGISTTALAEALRPLLRPACIAMCGVCAGHPEDTERGDVILADRVFQHDYGKQKPGDFQADLWVHTTRWLYAAQELEGAAEGLHGYALPDEEAARWWFLDKLLPAKIDGEPEVVHDPMKSVGLRRYVPDDRRTAFLKRLEEDLAEVEVDGMTYSLTGKGKKAVERFLLRHGTLVQSCPYHILVGPIGSGNYVEASGEVWRHLPKSGVRKTLGVEMEAAAIGELATRWGVPFVVAKGVMDHADIKKSDRYKQFAARSSAEVLVHFLRKVVEPRRETLEGEDESRGPLLEGPNEVAASPVPYFTGREDELSELEQRLLDGQGHTVVAGGKGGIGKTSLARHFVATRARECFPDGVAWLNGGDLVSEIGRLCERVGLGEAGRKVLPGEAIKLLWPVINPLRMLIVVDNFPQQNGNIDLIPRLGGRSRTLVTSRQLGLHGRIDASSLQLRLWTDKACIEYLRARCEHLEGVEDTEFVALGRFVGHLPLGMRLLVAFLTQHQDLSPAAALEVLGEQQLKALDTYDSAELRGVAKTFSASYEALAPDTRVVLQALAVCAPATRGDVVAAVAGLGHADSQLRELLQCSLAEFERNANAPWGLHEIVRKFVLEQPGCTQLEASHFAWVQAHIEQHTESSAWKGFSAGVEEARRAFQRLDGNLPMMLSIYEPLENHLRTVGRSQEAIALSEDLLKVGASDSQVVALARNNLGLCFARLGDTRKAIAEHNRSLRIAEDLGHLQAQAAALGNLGSCYRTLGDIPMSIELHGRALTISRKLDTLRGETQQLLNLGSCYLTLGDFPKAIGLIYRSLVIEGHLGGREVQAAALGNLGLCYRKLGHVSQAIKLFEHDLAIEEELGHSEGRSNALINIGTCHQMLGDLPSAIEILERALAISMEIGYREGQAVALGNLASCYQSQGHTWRAIEMFESVLVLEEQDGRREGQAIRLGALGTCHFELGDLPRAIHFFERAIAIDKELGIADGLATHVGNLAGCYLALGNISQAIELLKSALHLHEQVGSLDGQANALGNLGLIQAEHGFPEAARDYLSQAMKIYNSTGLPAPPQFLEVLKRMRS